MMRSMYSGVTGLKNHQIRMDAIGNNIANVNTVGYKSSRVTFQDTLNQTLRGASASTGTRGGTNAIQVGLGMNLSSIDILHTQGNIQNTGNTTDCAIQGDGFFVLSDGGRQYYTRAGNFNLEENGLLVNASNGMIVQGWLANNMGNINTNAPLESIQIPVGQTVAPIATTEITYGGNLDKNLDGLLEYTALSVGSATGENCTLEIRLTPVGFNEYDFTVSTATTGVTIVPSTGRVTLNDDGSVQSNTLGNFTVNFPLGSSTTVDCPAMGQTNGGLFRAFKPTAESAAFPGFNPATPWGGAPLSITSGNITIQDDLGNNCTVTLTLEELADTWPNPGTYTWTINDDGGATSNITSGGTGTFTWDGNQITSCTTTTPPTIIQSSAAPGLQISVNGLTLNSATPAIRVTGKEGDYTGTFTQSETMVTITRVYDSLGSGHNLTTTLTKTDVNEWDWVCVNEGGNNIGSGHLIYSSTGELISSTGSNITFTPTGARPIVIIPDFSDVTQYSGSLLDPSSEDYDPTVPMTEISSPFQDGYPMGELQSINIDNTGTIVGVFSNGMNQSLGQLAMANFTNPGGLSRSGDTLFSETSNSGVAQIGIAGRSGRGKITPGAIEMANVDLSQEFTDMIVNERGFQSNSRVITTSDEMLQELVNLKR